MKTYLDLLDKVLTKGKSKDGRNGGTLSLSGERIEIMLRQEEFYFRECRDWEGKYVGSIEENYFVPIFPLLTTKKMHLKSIVWELFWFLSGSTNIKMLKDNKVTIWDEWADEDGEVGLIYGRQWRLWNINSNQYGEGEDQINKLIHNLRTDPYSRRHVVSAWNVVQLDRMALPPCHFAFQMIVETDNTLTCIVTMRSCDIFLGLPFNIASYALLTNMLAKECGYTAGKLVINFGDLHLYENHVTAAIKQLQREPLPLPTLDLTGFDMQKCLKDPASQYEFIKVVDYKSYSTIKAPISK